MTLLALLTVAVAALAAPGDLDTGFGNGGVVIEELGMQQGNGSAGVVDDQDRLLALGRIDSTDWDFVVFRYLPNGQLDDSWGTDGAAIVDVSGRDYAGAIALTPDGGLVVVGTSGPIATSDIGVVKLTADGTLDPAFSGDGKHMVSPGGRDFGEGVAVTADGRIVVAGATEVGINTVLAVAVLEMDGGFDTGFSGTGIVTDVGPGVDDWAEAVAVAADGTIVVVGSTDGDVLTVALTPDGQLDSGFAGDGVAIFDGGGNDDGGTAVAIDSSGRFVVAGQDYDGKVSFTVLRYNGNGTLDAGFGTQGVAKVSLSAWNDYAQAVAVDPTGHIVIAGYTGITPNRNVGVARLTAAGAVDSTFGQDGYTTTDLGGEDFGRGLAVADDGTIFVIGDTDTAGSRDLLVVKYEGTPPPPTTTLPDPPQCQESFQDDDGSVFEGDINCIAAAGITRGCNPPDNTMYCPEAAVTRGQMAAFLVRSLGLPPGSGGFVDTVGHLFQADVAALAAAEVTKGCNPPTNDRFCPDDPVTRGQMAAFLARALDLAAGNEEFSDTVGHLFELDIAALAHADITRGCNPPANTLFCPDDAVTRGQMAAFLNRALLP